MSLKVTIFGKNACPYTTSAREDFAKRGYEVDYIDVLADPEQMRRMEMMTMGRREVPVIMEGGQVTIGFGGT